MRYIDFQGKKLSMLGFGAMRLPTLGKDDEIDFAEAEKMIDRAMDAGINYYDTAFPYHGGNSEIVTAKVLSKYPRDSYYLATKYPGHQVLDSYDPSEVFEEQLKKCKVDYFDFYLLHNVSETSIATYLDERWNIVNYFIEQKKQGRIKHLGFSTHGLPENLKQFLDVYGEHMEFCQIQLNWLDWKLQNAKAKVDMLREFNLPVWVMEPVRGGKLVSLEEGYEKILKEARPDASVVEWAFRFLQTIPDVGMTLSGMSNFEQLRQNIATYETEKPLNEAEWNMLLGVAQKMTEKDTLPCTACRYCTTNCPMELDIPMIIDLYNEFNYSGGGFVPPMVIRSLPEDKRPAACIGCRACESVCPQNIKISEMMSDFTEKLNK